MNNTDSRGAANPGNRRIRQRLVQAALVIGLVIISSATVASLSPGGPLFGAVGNPPATTIPPPARSEGFLDLTINENSNTSRATLCFAGPIWNSTIVLVPFAIACAPSVLPRNVTFVAVQQGPRFPERHTFVVGVPGKFSIAVGVGNYTITAANSYFNLTAFASVAPAGTTDVIVQLTNNYFVSRLTEAYDSDLSGAVGPWGHVEMLLQYPPSSVRSSANSSLYSGEPVYIQTIYYPVGHVCSNCVLDPLLPYEATLATVTQITKSPGGYWASMVPRSIIDLQNINNAWVVTVSASYTVVQGV